jgi:hypothetical protein
VSLPVTSVASIVVRLGLGVREFWRLVPVEHDSYERFEACNSLAASRGEGVLPVAVGRCGGVDEPVGGESAHGAAELCVVGSAAALAADRGCQLCAAQRAGCCRELEQGVAFPPMPA